MAENAIGRGIAAIIDEDLDRLGTIELGGNRIEPGLEGRDQLFATFGDTENVGDGTDLIEQLGKTEGPEIAAFDIEAGIHAQIVQLVAGVAGFAEAIGIAGIDEVGFGREQLFGGGHERGNDRDLLIDRLIGRADLEVGHIGRAGHVIFEA